jgi:hypothetical protein
MFNTLILMQVFLPQILFFVSRELRRRRLLSGQREKALPLPNEVRGAGSNSVAADRAGIRTADAECPLRLAA